MRNISTFSAWISIFRLLPEHCLNIFLVPRNYRSVRFAVNTKMVFHIAALLSIVPNSSVLEGFEKGNKEQGKIGKPSCVRQLTVNILREPDYIKRNGVILLWAHRQTMCFMFLHLQPFSPWLFYSLASISPLPSLLSDCGELMGFRGDGGCGYISLWLLCRHCVGERNAHVCHASDWMVIT